MVNVYRPHLGVVKLVCHTGYSDRPVHVNAEELWPDLSDPATLGCLLALAAGDENLWECGVHPDGGGFFTIADKTWTGATLAHAAVAALESAP